MFKIGLVPVVSFILISSSTLTFAKIAPRCDLVPDNPGSCLTLQATPYITTSDSQFGPFIEGASVNPAGDIFAVNYGNANTMFQLGQVYPQQKFFYRDDRETSLLNGIRFLNPSTAFVVDAVNHRVLKLNVAPGNVVESSETYCSDPTMLQPNDLTLASTGTVFTSGMRWLADTSHIHGDIWSCTPDGRATRLELMGRTNGIDLSPDETILYVSESFNRIGNPYIQLIWRYRVDVVNGTIGDKRIFANFQVIDDSAGVDIDGIKTDTEGNVYVTRHGGGQVVVFSPDGEVIGRISLPSMSNPTNLEFGGPSGTTLFIVGQCGRNGIPLGNGCVDRIEMANAGRSWSMLQRRRSENI